jgi:L-alanine-DL-glutamate epimerase-like enolase superfamily enzyme
MKIAQIDVFPLRLNRHYRVAGHSEAPNQLPGTDYYIEPQWVHAYSRVLEALVLKITADDGSFGWGEVQAPLTPQTSCALITTLLGPALLGQDPLATTALFDRLYELMMARGHFGSFYADAMAGLDIALWDLAARHRNLPLRDLLEGPKRPTLPAYASGLRATKLEEKITLARQFRTGGFAGVKNFTGAAPSAVAGELRAIRHAIGSEAFFAVDAICKYDVPTALEMGRVLDDVRASWFEAPLHAEDIEGHAALAREIATPVAVGETLRTPRQFEPWLRARALEIAQPDLMRTGVTGALRIAALAAKHDVPTTLHTGICTGIGMAATWQVAAAMRADIPQEHQADLFTTAGSVLRTPLVVREGQLVVPEAAGIGVEVDEAAVKSLATEHWVVDAKGRRQLATSN